MTSSFSRPWFSSLMCGLGLICCMCMLLGCDGESKPLSASGSQFKVAGEGGGAEAAPADESDLQPAADDEQATDAEEPSLDAPARSKARPDVNSKAKSVAKSAPAARLKAGDTASIVAELEALSPNNYQPKGSSREEMAEDFIAAQNRRLSLARQVVSSDADKEAKETAVQAAMETFAMFAQANIPGLTGERLKFARTLSQDKDPDISRMGRFVAYGVKLDELFNKRMEEGTEVLAEIKKLLDSEGDELHRSTAQVAQQGAQLLMQAGLKEDAAKAYEMVAAACRKNPELAAEAKRYGDQARLVKSDLSDLFIAALQGTEGAEAELIAEIESLLADLEPSAQMFAEFQEIAFRLEVIGKLDAAKQCWGLLADKFKDFGDEELAEQTTRALAQAEKRMALVGQPFQVEGFLRDGEAFDWTAYKGKVVLVDYWATWCEPCLAEIPNIEENFELFGDKGFAVVGINMNTVLSDYDDFFSTQELPWPSVLSKEVLEGKTDEETNFGSLPMAEKVGVNSLPFVLLVGKDGKVDSIHVRGPKLGKRLTELLGAPEGVPASEVPVDPTAKPDDAKPDDAKPAEQESERGAILQRGGPVAVMIAQAVLAADEPAADEAAVAAVPASEDPAINPYKAKPGLTTAQLVAYIERAMDRPKSIQSRPGFTEAVAEACDRVLAADPPAKEAEQLFACECKCEALHRKACGGDEACDKQLMEFVNKLSADERPRIQRLVDFFERERRVIDAAELPLEQIPELLKELDAYYAKEKLESRHVRMASSTVAAINRLEDGDAREQHFTSFGEQFAKSRDKELARYGKKLAKKPAVLESDLVGKPLELGGATADGANFAWDTYRGKVVLVDFWATWCGPCRRELPEVQALHEQHHAAGFEVVGVSVDEDLEALATFLDENELPWETLAGEGTQELSEKYGVRLLPTMMLVDKEGNVAAVAHSSAALAPLIEKLLKGESLAPAKK